ncbi:MAG: pyridoxamine 5'-phosphate oxidase [Proteobacteria bacterium]|nr:MAG: pyridoxamine 5'-phosphate oxidase [Pseudomonadota bacterium]
MPTRNPFEEFGVWFEQARANEPADFDAVALASATPDGRPSVRMVLMRNYDERGFVFYTNLESRKSHEMRNNPYAAMCFHWKSTERQIRIEGMVEQVDEVEADIYFDSRPRESQIAAWASKQSEKLEGRAQLERRVAKFVTRFGVGVIRRPDFWSGYRLTPDLFEFWDKRPDRLHERTLYTRGRDAWSEMKLFP